MYHLVTDLATLASLAEEATAMSWRKGDAARPGAVFKARTATASGAGQPRAQSPTPRRAAFSGSM